VVVGRRHPDRETEVYTDQRLAADRGAAGELDEADDTDASVLSPDAERVPDHEPPPAGLGCDPTE
jgi:hypothetical protein